MPKILIELGDDVIKTPQIYGLPHFITEAIANGTVEQEPKFIAKADGTVEPIKSCNDCIIKKEWERVMNTWQSTNIKK